MDLQGYWLFVGASIVLCIVPGPDMVYLLTRSIVQGKKAGIAAALGINLGAYFHLAAAILGISAIIATSSVAFTILKWCGALYLIYIGLQAILSKSGPFIDGSHKCHKSTLKAVFWQGFVSDVLNPKVAIFFISLLPQFIQPEASDPLTQLIILGLTVNVIALLINLVLVLFSQAVSSRLRKSNRVSFVLNKIMGGIFIGLGIRLANESR